MNIVSAILIIGSLLLSIAAVATLIVAVRNAEDGYEDDTGFHRIPKKAAKARQRRHRVRTRPTKLH